MSPPSHIAHYGITGKLGEGGMGVVYRATDTKLNRDVAIKFLPEAFAADPDRLSRFAREAQVLASLNHPNIAAIYGVEDRALVLELVEGPALDERIKQGPIPWEEALPLIRQLMDALDSAHMKGVIHRDLKPANIKVTPEGQLKVLDFGLAKALSPQAASSSPATTDSPTLTIQAGTVAGVILGTAAYMAPEQARGKTVDKRADIWAMGVVVFEMLSGKRLFEGETVTDVLAQTLTKPIDWNLVPPQARKLLRRCLDRDPKTRLRDVGDALDLLEEPRPVSTPAPRQSRIWIAAAVGGLVLAAVFAALWQRDSARGEPEPVMRVSVAEAGAGLLLSPDGSAILWMGDGDIRLRRMEDLSFRPLPGTEGGSWPFWAGDSTAIGFFQQGKLCVQSLRTEGIRCLASAPDPRGAAWRGTAASGDIVFASGAKLMRLDLSSGSVREVPVNFPAGQVPWRPTFLPQGGDLAVTAGPRGAGVRTLYRVSLPGGALTRLMETRFPVEFARHSQNGEWYMFYSSPLTTALATVTALMAVPVDPSTGQSSGTPVQLVDGVGTNRGLMAAGTSQRGAILFRRHRYAAPVFRIRWHAPDGKVLASLGDKMPCSAIVLSPDESSVAAITGYPRTNILILDARSGDSRRLTTPADNVGQGLAWSPDGGKLYYQIERSDGTWDIVRQGSSGGTRPEVIGRIDFTGTLMDISPDGRYLILGSRAANGSIYRLRTDGAADSKPEVWVSAGPVTPFVTQMARFTPDAKFVFSVEGRGEGRFIPWRPERPATTVDARAVTFSLTGPFFSRDGRRLCGLEVPRGLTCHSVAAAPDGSLLLGPPSFQFGGVTTMVGSTTNVAAAASDGRFLLISTDEHEELDWQLLTDWTMLLPGSGK